MAVVKRWPILIIVSMMFFISCIYYSKFESEFVTDLHNISTASEGPATELSGKATIQKSQDAAFPAISYVNATFFIEVSGKPDLSYRQKCAVEAAATAHSNYPVIVYMTGFNGTRSPWTKPFKNMEIRTLNLDELFLNTHLEKVYTAKGFREKPVIEHVADLSRIALLKKHGGLYLDIDMILMKSALVFESFILKNQGNGVLRLNETSPLLAKFYEKLGDVAYKRGDYTLLGSKIIRQAVKEMCHLNNTAANFKTAAELCHINFVDDKVFEPVAWFEFKKLFSKDVDLSKFRSNIMKKAVAFHFAGHVTNNIPVFKNSSSLFNEIAKKYCPIMFRNFPSKY
ncbi:lactosylceramide 4-alpha-galactosyltransferase-like [Artemia franciscana]|uniref:Alpha 1,4-glycosyltransferase domain-containing protein n=1 Tax=Artemia franciscana TaxID=6661 RepID=A0AA88HMI3_ARTSF|nr:hypothetical protein QYM36_011648 [Artemia franciscana]